MIYESYSTFDGRVYACPKSNGTATTEDFLRDLQDSTTFTRADGAGLLAALSSFVAEQLAAGKRVTLDGLGTFGVSFTVDSVAAGEITGNDVRLKRITFKAHPSLKQTVGHEMNVRRIVKDFRRDASVPPREARLAALLALIEERGEVMATDYRQAVGVSAPQAYKDLARFEAEGRIVSRPIGRSRLYRKR